MAFTSRYIPNSVEVFVVLLFALGLSQARFIFPSGCSHDEIPVIDGKTGRLVTCTPCLVCPPGMGSTVDCETKTFLSTSNITCVPCIEGVTFNDKNTSYKCRPCSYCSPFEEMPLKCTVKQDVECGECKNGTYRNVMTYECLHCSKCCGGTPTPLSIAEKCKSDGWPPDYQCKQYDKPCSIADFVQPSPPSISYEARISTVVRENTESLASEKTPSVNGKDDAMLHTSPTPAVNGINPTTTKLNLGHATLNRHESEYRRRRWNDADSVVIVLSSPLTYFIGFIMLLMGASAATALFFKVKQSKSPTNEENNRNHREDISLQDINSTSLSTGRRVETLSSTYQKCAVSNPPGQADNDDGTSEMATFAAVIDVLTCTCQGERMNRTGSGEEDRQTGTQVNDASSINVSCDASTRGIRRHQSTSSQASVDNTAFVDEITASEESIATAVEDRQTGTQVNDASSINVSCDASTRGVRHQSTSSQASVDNTAFVDEITASEESIATAVERPEVSFLLEYASENEVLTRSTESIFQLVRSFSPPEVDSRIAVFSFIKDLMQSRVKDLPWKYRKDIGMKLMLSHPFGHDYRSFGEKIGLSNDEVKAIGERQFDFEFIVDEFRRKTDGKMATLKGKLLQSERNDIVEDVIYTWLEENISERFARPLVMCGHGL